RPGCFLSVQRPTMPVGVRGASWTMRRSVRPQNPGRGWPLELSGSARPNRLPLHAQPVEDDVREAARRRDELEDLLCREVAPGLSRLPPAADQPAGPPR